MKLIFLFILSLIRFGHSEELNLRNLFSKALKTTQDQHYLTQIEQRLPKFIDLDIPTNENIDKVFSKFKEFIRLIPASIHRETLLNANSAREVFPAIQPIYRYVKESVWKTILKLIDLPKELIRIPAQNLPETNLNHFLKYSDEKTVSKVLELNSNRQDFNDEQKTIIVENYIDKIKNKLNPSNFQQLITQSLGASFLRYVPLDFLIKDPIFNDNNVIRNVATWLHLLKPLQRDAITNKVYRSLTNTTGKSVQNDPNNPLYLTENDPSTLDMLARMMPSLSTRQIIKTIGEKIIPLLERSSIGDDQSCSTALALLNRTIESKKTSNRYFRTDPKLVQHWQTCYSGCDLRNLFSNRQEIKDLLKNHPNPESCEDLVAEVKKEYGLERDIASIKLRETADVFGAIYRSDEINNLNDEFMADLGRDEKALEKLGSQDLTPQQARAILNKIPRSTQNLWGKNMLSKLGNLIPGIDNVILKQILTRGRGELPSLFNHTTPSFIRKLVPSKIRLLIDQYATEPNLAKYRQFLASNYAKKYIQSDSLMKILQLAPDVLRLIRFTPAQASAAISNRLGMDKHFDGSLSSLGLINNFLNGLTKTDIEKIKAEESLQAIQHAFGSSKSKTIDNQMQSNTRYAFGNLLRRGLQTSENTQNIDEYIKGLFREDNLVEDLNPELFTTMTNNELEAISRLDKDQADRFWNAIGSIREPSCCSIINENRFRLADYALKYYGSTTGELDNFKLSQLGPFLITSLRANDLRRMTTDALMNKIHVFKSSCFQGNKAEGQALGSKLNDALGEVDDGLKNLYLDLIGELAVYFPNEISTSKKILSKRINYLSNAIDKVDNRNDQCQIIDTNEYSNELKENIKKILANAYLEQRSPSDDIRIRRQINLNKNSITCRDLRQMGSSISSLSSQQISSISNDIIFECINAFSVIKYAKPEFVQQIAEKYIQALQSQGRHIQSLTQNELYELNSILTGFTPSELFQLKNQPFHDGNFLAFIGNLNGWTVEQLKILAQLVLGSDQRLTPTIIENAGQILCVIDEQLLRRIPADHIKSNLPILAYLECPIDSNINYSSIMFDIVRNIYQADILRPHIFGSLGIIAAGLKSTDIPSLSPELINFFPSKAFAYLSKDTFQSFSNNQFENFNIEQIQAIPNHLFNSLNSKQSSIMNQIRYPFKSTEELTNHIDISTTEIDESGANMQAQCSIYFLSILSLLTIFFTH